MIYYTDELYHWRTRGSKNGVRRYQNPDGSYKPGAEGRYDPMYNQRDHWDDNDGGYDRDRERSNDVYRSASRSIHESYEDDEPRPSRNRESSPIKELNEKHKEKGESFIKKAAMAGALAVTTAVLFKAAEKKFGLDKEDTKTIANDAKEASADTMDHIREQMKDTSSSLAQKVRAAMNGERPSDSDTQKASLAGRLSDIMTSKAQKPAKDVTSNTDSINAGQMFAQNASAWTERQNKILSANTHIDPTTGKKITSIDAYRRAMMTKDPVTSEKKPGKIKQWINAQDEALRTPLLEQIRAAKAGSAYAKSQRPPKEPKPPKWMKKSWAQNTGNAPSGGSSSPKFKLPKINLPKISVKRNKPPKNNDSNGPDIDALNRQMLDNLINFNNRNKDK